MFEKLGDLARHYEELEQEMSDPAILSDQERYRKVMKARSDLEPVVETYRLYLKVQQDLEDSKQLLLTEDDPEMRELLKDEVAVSGIRLPELEKELKLLLLPKDPNDDRNVILEIRAGAGG